MQMSQMERQVRLRVKMKRRMMMTDILLRDEMGLAMGLVMAWRWAKLVDFDIVLLLSSLSLFPSKMQLQDRGLGSAYCASTGSFMSRLLTFSSLHLSIQKY